MSRRTYILVSLSTLAIFSIALVWPEFVLGLVARLTPAPRASEPVTRMVIRPYEPSGTATSTLPAGSVDLADINFDLPADVVAAAEAEEGSTAVTIASTSTALTRNRLIIPRIKVDADVIFANTDTALRKGLWHIPGSAVPGTNGNIVVSAHRWLHKYPHPASFYAIDKIQVGDPIYYDYHGSRYEYRVTRHFVVNPDQVEILDQDENKLTLFTCTPLYSTKQRYVVNADLVSVTPLK